MKYLLLCLFIIANAISFAQSEVLSKIPFSGKDIRSFIPTGYDTIETARGDLNRDGIEDAVLCLKSISEESFEMDNEPPRILIVLFKDKKGSYQLAGKSAEVIMCVHCGDIFGDPFEEVSIEKGALRVHHYGGSNWRWGYTHKFRYQQNDFFLIGETKWSYWSAMHCEKLDDFGGTEYMDINYLTGEYKEKKTSADDCKLLVDKKGKRKIKPLERLSKFSLEN